MADIVAVNKADGDNVIRADQTRMDFKRALHLFPPPASGWTVPVLTCSALTGTGMEHLLEQIMDYRTFVNSNGLPGAETAAGSCNAGFMNLCSNN